MQAVSAPVPSNSDLLGLRNTIFHVRQGFKSVEEHVSASLPPCGRIREVPSGRSAGRRLVMSLCELVGRGEVRTRVECPIRRTQLGRGWGGGGVVLVVLVSGGGVNRNLGACKLVYLLHAHHGQVCPTHQHQIRPALAKLRRCRGFTSKQLTPSPAIPSPHHGRVDATPPTVEARCCNHVSGC